MIAADSLLAEIVNVALGTFLFLPFLLVLIDTFFRVLFLAVAGFSRRQSKLEIRSEAPDLRLLILVLAHNEQRIITRTLDLIQSQIAGDSSVTLALLADNCTDDTVEMANQSGVKVFIRGSG